MPSKAYGRSSSSARRARNAAAGAPSTTPWPKRPSVGVAQDGPPQALGFGRDRHADVQALGPTQAFAVDPLGENGGVLEQRQGGGFGDQGVPGKFLGAQSRELGLELLAEAGR